MLIHSAGFSSVVFCFMLFDERFARTFFLREPFFTSQLPSCGGGSIFRYVGAASVHHARERAASVDDRCMGASD